MRVLQWFLVLPAAAAGWILGILVGSTIQSISDRLCPIEYVVSQSCFAPWSESVFRLAMAVGAGVAGATIVVFPALMAPNWRHKVAMVCFVSGALTAIYFLTATGEWLAFVTALLAGGLSCRCVAKLISDKPA